VVNITSILLPGVGVFDRGKNSSKETFNVYVSLLYFAGIVFCSFVIHVYNDPSEEGRLRIAGPFFVWE
jgi:uncharacterized membrane protein YqaE (UPF0057 family)